MSEFNFDKLKNHEIPDSWVSGALNVPPKDEKPPIVFAKFSKTLAFVATFAVVCALSVTLFIFTQKGDTLLPHTPTQSTVETALPTHTPTDSTESNSSTNESETTPTNPTEPQTDSTTESSEDLEEETTVETSKPTQRPSDSSTTPNSKPSKPSSPTVAPDSSTEEPEDNPPTSNPDAEKNPNGGASSTPNGGPANGDTSPSKKIVLSDTISLETYLSDPDIYFCISSFTPDNMDGGNKFPDIKKADIIFANGMVHIEYIIDNEEEKLKPGKHQYVFYNSMGMISTGTFEVY